MNVLVTGANGFVGRGVIRKLVVEGRHVVAAVRRRDARVPASVETRMVGDLSSADWRPLLGDVTHVVHLAARVHILRERAADPLLEFRRTNVEGTARLARQAADAGVHRLVFVSSIKVNGERGTFSERSAVAPTDPYGLSKWEAEECLRRTAEETGLEVVVLRPPLIYGPGVGGNLASLIRVIERGVPLPLAMVDNRRSLVGLDNLADLVNTVLEHPSAGGETFMVSDGEDLSTPELVKRIAAAMKRSPRLFPVPTSWLGLAAKIAGKHDVAQRILESLQIETAKASALLGWRPPVTVDEGLRRAIHEIVPKNG